MNTAYNISLENIGSHTVRISHALHRKKRDIGVPWSIKVVAQLSVAIFLMIH